MKPLHLRTFATVAQEGGIRAAARTLGVSQSAVTRIVKELEEDLEVPLVKRTTRGVDLTEFGHALAIRANLILAESERARQELRQMKSMDHARVRFATTSLPALLLLPRAVSEFRQRFPRVELECLDTLMANALPSLREGRVDFVLTQDGSLPTAPDLTSESLFTAPIVVAARDAHPKARCTQLRELADDDWIAASRDMTNALFSHLDLPPPQRVMIAHSLYLAQGLVEQSDLLGVFARPVLERSSRTSSVRALPISDSLPHIVVGMITRRGGPLTPAAAQLAESIRAACKTLPN